MISRKFPNHAGIHVPPPHDELKDYDTTAKRKFNGALMDKVHIPRTAPMSPNMSETPVPPQCPDLGDIDLGVPRTSSHDTLLTSLILPSSFRMRSRRVWMSSVPRRRSTWSRRYVPRPTGPLTPPELRAASRSRSPTMAERYALNSSKSSCFWSRSLIVALCAAAYARRE
jgi:hypothetical protein